MFVYWFREPKIFPSSGLAGPELGPGDKQCTEVSEYSTIFTRVGYCRWELHMWPDVGRWSYGSVEKGLEVPLRLF